MAMTTSPRLTRFFALAVPAFASWRGPLPLSPLAQGIALLLESDNLESAIRLGISLGGDADTIGCMAGGIAQAYYEEIPREINDKVIKLLTPDLLEIVEQFNTKYKVRSDIPHLTFEFFRLILFKEIYFITHEALAKLRKSSFLSFKNTI